MYYKEFLSAAALKPYIRAYFHIRISSKRFHIPADGCPGLIFNIGDPFLLGSENDNLTAFSGCWLFESVTRQLLTRQSGQSELVAVKFLPGQFTRFFEIPAIELTDSH